MDQAVTGQNPVIGNLILCTVKGSDPTTGLLHQQRTRRNIPRLQLYLPEPVQPSGSQPG